VSNLSTTIQPVLIVDGGGTPVPPAGGGAPQATDGSADLAVAALDFTDAIASVKDALWVSLHVVEANGLLADEVFTISLDSGSGAGFDTIIVQETLPIGTKDKFFAFPANTLLRATDHIRVQLSNTGAPANNVNATLMEGG
jgi:hypothetical protein